MEIFYSTLPSSDDRIAGHFEQTDREKQKKLLADSLIHVLNFAAGDSASRRKVEMLSEKHRKGRMGILPELYSSWQNSLVSALQQLDPQWNGQLESAWRSQLDPAIDQMKSNYDSRTAALV